jgi:hypothetical protein
MELNREIHLRQQLRYKNMLYTQYLRQVNNDPGKLGLLGPTLQGLRDVINDIELKLKQHAAENRRSAILD